MSTSTFLLPFLFTCALAFSLSCFFASAGVNNHHRHDHIHGHYQHHQTHHEPFVRDSNEPESVEIDGVQYAFGGPRPPIATGPTWKVYDAVTKPTNDSGPGPLMALKVIDFNGLNDEVNYREKYLEEYAVVRDLRNNTARYPEHVLQMFATKTDKQRNKFYVLSEPFFLTFEQAWQQPETGLRDHYKRLLASNETHAEAAKLLEAIALQVAVGLQNLHDSYTLLTLDSAHLVFAPEHPRENHLPEVLARLGTLKLAHFGESAPVVEPLDRGDDNHNLQCPLRQKYRGNGTKYSRVAPEYLYQCTNRRGERYHQLSTKADVWSFGVFLWELMFRWVDESGGVARESGYAGRFNDPIYALMNATDQMAQSEEQRSQQTYITDRMLRMAAMRAAAGAEFRLHSAENLARAIFGVDIELKSEAEARAMIKPFERLIAIMQECLRHNPDERPSMFNGQMAAYLEGTRQMPPLVLTESTTAFAKYRAITDQVSNQWDEYKEEAKAMVDRRDFDLLTDFVRAGETLSQAELDYELRLDAVNELGARFDALIRDSQEGFGTLSRTLKSPTLDELKNRTEELYDAYEQFLSAQSGICDWDGQYTGCPWDPFAVVPGDVDGDQEETNGADGDDLENLDNEGTENGAMEVGETEGKTPETKREGAANIVVEEVDDDNEDNDVAGEVEKTKGKYGDGNKTEGNNFNL